MTNFTPIASTCGGILIGISASLLLMIDGKVAGISGIVGGILRPVKGDVAWRSLFLAGLLGGGVLMAILYPRAFASTPRPLWLVVAAGLFVGAGTRLGSGCTSGHGVCGISRFSKRSIFATMTFMATGMVTVFVLHRVFGLR